MIVREIVRDIKIVRQKVMQFFKEERNFLMKTKGHRIFGCLLLICAVGLAVGICTSVANSKIPLSDNALSSIYGGCGDCLPNGKGCAGQHGIRCEDQTYDGCGGSWSNDNCRQTKKSCQGTNLSTCEPTTALCDGTYTHTVCERKEVGSYKWCGVKSSESRPCTGSKAWCTQ